MDYLLIIAYWLSQKLPFAAFLSLFSLITNDANLMALVSTESDNCGGSERYLKVPREPESEPAEDICLEFRVTLWPLCEHFSHLLCGSHNDIAETRPWHLFPTNVNWKLLCRGSFIRFLFSLSVFCLLSDYISTIIQSDSVFFPPSHDASTRQIVWHFRIAVIDDTLQELTEYYALAMVHFRSI